MNKPSADTQGEPNKNRSSHTPATTDEHNPGGLMPDIRGDALSQGRDPEEVDPLTLDEDTLRRDSSNLGVLKP